MRTPDTRFEPCLSGWPWGEPQPSFSCRICIHAPQGGTRESTGLARKVPAHVDVGFPQRNCHHPASTVSFACLCKQCSSAPAPAPGLNIRGSQAALVQLTGREAEEMRHNLEK
jgi:hypothetical protein